MFVGKCVFEFVCLCQCAHVFACWSASVFLEFVRMCVCVHVCLGVCLCAGVCLYENVWVPLLGCAFAFLLCVTKQQRCRFTSECVCERISMKSTIRQYAEITSWI